ncbi:MAG: copper chaperone PCu(A)C [Gammaproteobacteria bacterium]|nr:copper chaperone PCu(A)C [Gammaproteobacteria bacterium]
MKNSPKFSVATPLLLVGIGLWALMSATQATASMLVKNAWVREAPPNATVLAAYLQIENNANTAIHLNKVSSTAFKQVEMHDTVVDKEGTATMRRQTQVTIPANGQVAFEPGGLHLMLITPQKRLKSGDKVELSLTFSDGSQHSITAVVKKVAAKLLGPQHHHNHDHAQHKANANKQHSHHHDDSHKNHHMHPDNGHNDSNDDKSRHHGHDQM